MEFLSVFTSTNWVNKKLKPFIVANKGQNQSQGLNEQYMQISSYSNEYNDRIPLMSMTSSSMTPSYINNDNNYKNKKFAVKLKRKIKVKQSEYRNSINSNESGESLCSSLDINNDENMNMKELKIRINVNIKLRDILSHSKGFESFILHLSSEFSIENLLCLVELSQFQIYIHQYLINNNNASSMNIDENEMFGLTISWPLNVPRSLIIFGKNEKDDELQYDDDMQFYYVCKIKAKKLFEKYINTSSQYEVNLSYSVRNKLISLMRNESNWILNNNKYKRKKEKEDEIMSLNDLMHIFDSVVNEVFQLMQDAFNRFKNTNNFHKVKALIIQNK